MPRDAHTAQSLSHECSPCRGLYVRRERVGGVHRARVILCRPQTLIVQFAISKPLSLSPLPLARALHSDPGRSTRPQNPRLASSVFCRSRKGTKSVNSSQSFYPLHHSTHPKPNTSLFVGAATRPRRFWRRRWRRRRLTTSRRALTSTWTSSVTCATGECTPRATPAH